MVLRFLSTPGTRQPLRRAVCAALYACVWGGVVVIYQYVEEVGIASRGRRCVKLA
jgi:hypothetical protein